MKGRVFSVDTGEVMEDDPRRSDENRFASDGRRLRATRAVHDRVQASSRPAPEAPQRRLRVWSSALRIQEREEGARAGSRRTGGHRSHERTARPGDVAPGSCLAARWRRPSAALRSLLGSFLHRAHPPSPRGRLSRLPGRKRLCRAYIARYHTAWPGRSVGNTLSSHGDCYDGRGAFVTLSLVLTRCGVREEIPTSPLDVGLSPRYRLRAALGSEQGGSPSSLVAIDRGNPVGGRDVVMGAASCVAATGRTRL